MEGEDDRSDIYRSWSDAWSESILKYANFITVVLL